MKKENYYDAIAESYDELYGKEQRKKILLIQQLLKKYQINANSTLDVGAGTGAYTKIINENIKNVDHLKNIISVDPSEKLLAKNPFPKRIASAENLPFANDNFELVVSVTAVHNFNDIKKGIKEIFRVSKKWIIITVLNKTANKKNILALIKNQGTLIEEIDEGMDSILLMIKKIR